MSTVDLFGNTIEERLPGGPMCQRFIEPPFTILDGRSDRWQARKRDWLALGIESEVGRDVSGSKCTSGKNSALFPTAQARIEHLEKQTKGSSYDAHPNKHLSEKDQRSLGVMLAKATVEREEGTSITATSIFDPTLCELVYNWFLPRQQSSGVLDPFAGGSVRGIVAARLGHQYTGVELRVEQVEANVLQGLSIHCNPKPIWTKGDSAQIETLVGNEYDLLFTCPPYWNLERYSDLDSDLSTLDNWDDFAASYCQIMARAAGRVKDNRFAVVVVGNIRDKKGNIRDMKWPTELAMKAAGFNFYNDFILVTPIGSLPLRVNQQFSKNRKAGSSHQYVLCFYKGDVSEIREQFTTFATEAQ